MFPNTPTRSPGSPMSEDSVPHAIPSIASIFPPYYSESDGSASDEMIPQYSNSISIIFPPTKSETESSESNQRFGQISHSISSVFPPTKSQSDESSESNQILTRFAQYSISSIFPPTKSESESSESDQTSNSISSVFPPTKSQTDQSSESNLGNTTTSASTPPPQPNSAELRADSVELDSGAEGEEPARTLRPVWTPQLHKRFVYAVALLGIEFAVPKTILQLMSVDGLTRENVASHLQAYHLYLKRIQGESAGAGGSGPANGAGGLAATSAAPAIDHLFASSPVPPQFLRLGLPNSDHFLPFGQVAALPHHHHHHHHPQQMVATVAHPQLQPPFHRQVGHFGSPPNGQFEHPFLSTRQSQPVHRTRRRVWGRFGIG